MGDEGWVVGVADDDAGDAFGAAVRVEDVGLEMKWLLSGCDGFRRMRGPRGSSHFSSTSCLWPGRVRSATALAKTDMNWP